jgi:hypothetical protein
MPARRWTPEQKTRQAELIHKWKPWEQSTGARTPEGKKISGQNAVNYSVREVTRELARVNRELIPMMREFFEYRAEFESQFPGLLDSRPSPPPLDTSKMDDLLDKAEKAMSDMRSSTEK